MQLLFKKIKNLFLTLCLLVFSTQTWALLSYYEPGFFGDLGLTGYRYQYNETVNDRFFMKDYGALFGFYFNLGYQPGCTEFRTALEGYLAWSGHIRYKSNGTGSADNSNYAHLELRLLGFYPWALNCDWTLEAYSGIAIRAVANDDDHLITNTGHTGYLRTSHYNYVPIGARFIRSFDTYTLIPHAEFDWFLSGKQHSFIDGYLANKQNKGWGARGGVDFIIPSAFDWMDYLVGGFVRYWHIKDSEVSISLFGNTIGYEPKNTTWELGLRFGLVF